MTKTTMPKLIICGGGDEAKVGWRLAGGDGVEWTGTIAASDHAPCAKVLKRKTKGIKFDRDIIVSGEFMNR
jgi:hypothetical protein